MKKFPMPQNFKQQALGIYKNLIAGELAEKYNVSERTVYKWMKRCKLPRRPRANGVDKKRIMELLSTGATLANVAAIVQCSVKSVWLIKLEMDYGDERLLNSPRISIQDAPG